MNVRDGTPVRLPAITIVFLALGIGLLLGACGDAYPEAKSSESTPALPKTPTMLPEMLPTFTLIAPAATSIPTPIIPTPTSLPATRATPSPTTTRVIIYGDVATPAPFAPWSADSVSKPLIGLIWESLLSVDPQNGMLRAGLAKSWEVSDDVRTITFQLQEGVVWHDGHPFTAADVLATFEQIRSPASRSPWQFNLLAVETWEALDKWVVRLTLSESEAGCAALYDVGLVPIWPAHVTASEDAPALVGTGPFRFVEQHADGRIIVERNPLYREPVRLDRLIYAPYESAEALLQAWQAGDVDVAHFPAGFSLPEAALAPNSLITYPSEELVLAIFNVERSPLDDPNVRKALSLALDREQLVRQVCPLGATLLSASWPPSHWALDTTDLHVPPYDMDAARALLSQAGWTDEDGDGTRERKGKALSLHVMTNGENDLRVATAALLAHAYRQVGVESEQHTVQWGVFLDALFRRDFDIAVLSWPLLLDPDQRLFWHSSETVAGRGFNFAGWQNDRVDQLLEQAAMVPKCDAGARGALYGEIARHMADERPVDPLFVPHRAVLVRAGLTGIQPSPFAGPLWNAKTW